MKIYKTTKIGDIEKAQADLKHLISLDCSFKMGKIKETRSQKQNRALHLFFTIMSSELNELGAEFIYFGLKGQTLSTRYTPNIVKEHFWKPVQKSLFDIESTTKINTKQINEIIDVVTKFFAEKGVVVMFPNIETLIEKKKAP